MKKIIYFLLVALVLSACSKDDDLRDTVEAVSNAKAQNERASANLASVTTGPSQFLGTWKIDVIDNKYKWNEEERGEAPWVTFYADGTMVGDTVTGYFPTGRYVIMDNDVMMFGVESGLSNAGSQYYAKMRVTSILDYIMMAEYTGSSQSPVGEETIKVLMIKQQ